MSTQFPSSAPSNIEVYCPTVIPAKRPITIASRGMKKGKCSLIMQPTSSLIAGSTPLVHTVVRPHITTNKSATPTRQIVRYPVGILNAPKSAASRVYLARKASVSRCVLTVHIQCLVRPPVTMFYALYGMRISLNAVISVHPFMGKNVLLQHIVRCVEARTSRIVKWTSFLGKHTKRLI